MQVVKLGGSLSHSAALTACLAVLARPTQKTVIVPGGGEFANQVRLAQQRWQFNEVIAHEMAILAMQQMALLFQGLHAEYRLASSISEIKQQLKCKNAVIWSPTIAQLNQAAIPASWDITSDSLAAWLATTLEADELFIVKAADVETQALEALTQQGVLDVAFARFIRDAPYPFHIVNHLFFCAQQRANGLIC